VGASWKTSLVGWLLIGGDALLFIGDVIKTQGLPTSLMEWGLFGGLLLTGIGKLFSKDYDVSNSKDPAKASVVQPVAAITPNPAAVPKP
jgi:hypothetical protein